MKILGEMQFDEKLVILNLAATTDLEAIERLACAMQKVGVVKESFISAIQEREKVYATGLELEEMGIAIPHTDAEHVNVPSMALGILEKPVQFCGMGEPDKKVPVEIIFMLGIKEAHAQLTVLQALLKVFQREGKLAELKACTTNQQAVETLARLLSE